LFQVWYGENVGKTVEEIVASFQLYDYASCIQQEYADRKT